MNNFTRPKNLRFNHSRIPRKFKKKYKMLLNKYPWMELNQKIWFILGETNRPYRDFLISEVIKEDNLIQQKKSCTNKF